MRASFALVAFAAVASASSLSSRQNIPSCALTCMTSASTGSCGTDNSCLCKDSAFISEVYNCFASSCSAADLETANAAARQLCAAAGVTLTSTPAITATASATSAAASGTATGSATSAAASASASSNSAITFSGASPMVGALAAMAGFVFAL